MSKILIHSICLTGLLLLVEIAAAQSYQIDWFTIDGGGGASSSGNYTLMVMS